MAVAQCLENLVTNALKYRKDALDAAARGTRARADGGLDDVEISVSTRHRDRSR
jgi:hypothetical protein